MNKVHVLFATAVLMMSVCSCKRDQEITKIELPATPVLTMRSEWGVVISDVLRIRAEPGQSAEILTHVRQGTLVEILSQTVKKESIEDQTGYWYQVNYEGLRGWLFGPYIEVFDSKRKALNYKEKLAEELAE